MEKSDANSNQRIPVTIRAAAKPGAIKAHADVRVNFSASSLEIFGLSVVQQDSAKPAWVSYPQRPGKKEGKWYDVVKVTGKLHEEISSAVLAAYAEVQAKEESTPRPPKAQISREPGEETPF
jgi:DNA-binding cell septation regulator SpoVG